MIKSILLEGSIAEDIGVLTLKLNRKIQVKIPADEARRKVSQFVHTEISSQMRAETPTLVVGEKAIWRVPVHLTFPSFGDIGCVGYIEVDPVTSELNASQTIVEDICQNAEDLARRFTPAPKG
jgi:hypothetical protein